MQNEKQFDMYISLSPSDWQRFLLFLDFSLVDSTPPVAADDIKQLALFIQKNKKTSKEKGIDITSDSPDLFDRIFPDRKFVRGRLDKIQSALRREFEKFILYRVANQDDFFKDIALAQYYGEQKNADRFERIIEKLRTGFEKQNAKDRHTYLKSYWTELIDAEFQALYNVKKGDINYSNVVESLDAFYLTSRLDWLCILFNQKRAVKLDTTVELSFLEDLDRIIAKKGFSDTPSVKAYRMTIDLLLEKGNFDEFQQVLVEADPFLTFQQRQKLHAHERNICSARCNAGDNAFLPKLALLLKKHLAAGYLYYEGGLIPSTLQNLTRIGIRTLDFDWVKQMLEEHKNRIVSQDDPQEVFNFNWASLLFALGQYDEAMDLIQSPYKFRDIYYDLTKRSLEIKILFEQDNIGLCEFRCDAFKNYLFNWSKKNKADTLPTYVYVLNNNFVNTVSKMLKTRKGDKERLDKMIEEMQSARIGEREWLLEKLNDLK
jgi:hypothetical protein